MPTCLECPSLVNGECKAHSYAKKNFGRVIPAPPIGACTVQIVKNYTNQIKKGMRVLEVGCGTWSYLRDYCIEVGAYYEGIDTQSEYYGKKTIATRIENLSNLSYQDNYFDLVIGNQTIEHWAEFGCDTSWGLYQCFRVCKINGMVMLNAPIHFHGVKCFLNGDFKYINKIFSRFSNSVVIEKWGAEHYPLDKFITYKDYSKLNKSHAYIIDIQATKNIETLKHSNNRAYLPVRLKRWMNYDLYFLIYLLKKKYLRGLGRKS
jgi:ubiquinone/menaquinone biosynthesis C-methylase UbiE